MAGKTAKNNHGPKADAITVTLTVAGALGLVSLFGATVQAQAMDEGAVIFGVAGIVAAAALASRPASLVPRSRLGVAWAAFLGWALIAAALSGRVWSALVGESSNLLGWFALATLTLVVVAVSTRGQAARRALETIAPVVIFGEVAATLVQLARMAPARGSLPNSTYLGEALLLLLPFTLAEDSGGLELSRTARYALAVTTIVAITASGARVAAVVAFAWFVWVLLRRSSLAPRARVLATIGLLAVVAVAGFAFARAEILGSTGSDTLGERPQMWRAAALAVAERPLTGYGPDGFVAGGAAVTTPALARSVKVLEFREGAMDPHSLPVWVAVSTGIVGLALFLWALVEVALVWRRRAAEGVDIAPTVWAVVGTGLVLCTAPAAIEIMPLLSLVLGVSLAAPPGAGVSVASGRLAVRRAVGWVVVAVLGLSAVAYAGNTGTRLALEIHPYTDDSSLAKPQVAAAAMRLWPYDSHLAYLASLHGGLAIQADPLLGQSRPDLVAIERACELNTRDPFIARWRARVRYSYLLGDEQVEAAFEDAFARWPLYPVARAEYATFFAEQGRVAEANEQIAIAELVPVTRAELRDALEAARQAIASAEK